MLSAVWLEELQSDPHLTVDKEEFIHLRRELGKPHNLLNLYENYLVRITNVISNWKVEEVLETPELEFLMLKPSDLEMLKELEETDETSFRFRYPSLKHQDTDSLQKLAWQHDPSMLLPTTGLPKKAGYFFDPINVVNNLHKLISEIKTIESYFNGIREYQNVMNDNWNDYLNEFGYDGYEY